MQKPFIVNRALNTTIQGTASKLASLVTAESNSGVSKHKCDFKPA